MALKIKPLADRVVVLADEADEKSEGGIILPDTVQEKPQKGSIVALGAGKFSDNGELIKPEVKVGDKVLYGKYSGNEISINGVEYLIMRESDILAIV
ncbi:co-chaperone GroES [Candidatus Marinimicrobia bacterium MT.SAG.3]|nr:co-chaperone GroES [Candidatus Neomarinimicrobiota bacterium]MCH8305448.1 co-chaperone GroES [Candidatus Neomarinimicrobiota bacterium]TFB09374.1 co-chaperone GroES [Candidatus Marinimicrobia bacterium MT.SAG.2]TFB09612.1 co-chaperone GroES [Candidatus Marinimicrobia bacterium MT.SAG.3]TFB13269.1 co-chaperone GroES [Candidatus Marinimicrobia bacterium MT.SAG.4]